MPRKTKEVEVISDVNPVNKNKKKEEKKSTSSSKKTTAKKEPKVKKVATQKTEAKKEPKVKKATTKKTEAKKEPKVKKVATKKAEAKKEPKVKKATTKKNESKKEPKVKKVATKKTEAKKEPKVKKATTKKTEAKKEPKVKKVATKKAEVKKEPKVKKVTNKKAEVKKESKTEKNTTKIEEAIKKAIAKIAIIKNESKEKKVAAQKTESKKEPKEKKVAAKKTEAKKEPKVKKSSEKKSTSSNKSKKIAKSKSISFTAEYYDLPFRYNQTVVRILAQTPTNLFIYWEISDEDRANLKRQYGEYFFEITKPVLIVYNETLNYTFEVEIDDFANSWYLHVDDSNSEYKVELGRRPIPVNYSYMPNYDIEKNGPIEELKTPYFYISSSNELDAPNDRILFNKISKVYFRNVKTNELIEKDISDFPNIYKDGIFINIYKLYQELYKEEIKNDSFNLLNPSSGNVGSGSFSSRFY